MKKTLILLLLLSSRLVVAQVHFPLHKGDTWVYYWDDVLNEGNSLFQRVEKDTLMSNGKTYADFQFHTIYGPRFIRQENQFVYGLNATDSAEYVLLDFSAKSGDTISSFLQGRSKMVALGGMKFRYVPSAPYQPIDWTIQDSIGLINGYGGPGYHCYLGRAIIAGISKWPTTVQQKTVTPERTKLCQNYPNPFNPVTTVKFYVEESQFCRLAIYDLHGRCVSVLENSKTSSGWHERTWNGDKMPSGIYFYRLEAGEYHLTKSLMLIK